MARKKNIHPNYKEVKFVFLNSTMEPVTIRSTLGVAEKNLPKSVLTHEAWQKDRKKVTSSYVIKKRFDLDL
jgi:ribosomal protein L31